MEFVVGVLGSLVATGIAVVASALLSRQARQFFVTVIVRLLQVDMEAVFRNKQTALADIEAELGRAVDIWVLTGRGNELQRGMFAQLLGSPASTRVQSLRIMLPATGADSGPLNPDWLSLREGELSLFDGAYGSGLLRSQVEANIRYLEKPVRHHRAQLRLFNFPQIGRVIITDAVAYVSQYAADAHGRDSPIVKFRRGGPMYELCRRIFSVLWEQGMEVYPMRLDRSGGSEGASVDRSIR